jgi:hypothetical protein
VYRDFWKVQKGTEKSGQKMQNFINMHEIFIVENVSKNFRHSFLQLENNIQKLQNPKNIWKVY